MFQRCLMVFAAFLVIFLSWQRNAYGNENIALTLSEAVEVSLSYNYQLEASRYDFAAAQSQKKEAISALFPQLSFNSDVSKLVSDRFGTSFESAGFAGDTFSNRFQISQLIYDRSVFGEIRLAKLREKAAMWQEIGQAQNVVLETVLSFLDVLRAKELFFVQNQRLVQAEKQLHFAKTNYEVGFQTEVDVANAELARSSALHDIVLSEMAMERSQVALNRVLGLPVDEREELEPGIFSTLDLSSEKKISHQEKQFFFSISLQNNPSAQIAKLLVDQSQESVHIARREFSPRVSAGGNWGYFDRGNPNFEDKEWSVQTSIQIPIFEGGRKFAKVDRTKKQLEAEKMRYEDTIQNVYSLIENSILFLRERKKSLEISIEAETVAQKNQQRFLTLYEGGMADSLDVVQALTQLVETQTDIVTARYGYYRVYVQLLAALGILSTEAETYETKDWLLVHSIENP